MDNSSFFSGIKKFIYKNKQYIFVGILIVIVLYLSYYYSRENVTRRKNNEFEKAFIKRQLNQTNYCSDNLKYNQVSDFYIKSSSKSYLTGLQYYGYGSLELIKKILYSGVRFLEIDIFSNTYAVDAEPIISIGTKKGEKKKTLNSIKVKDFFKVIKDMAFSEKYIDTFREPLFIFMNLKTNNNKTLDKVYDIILNTILPHLLPKSFGKVQRDIGTIKMCDIMNKCVLLSSDGYKESKLFELINGSTTQSSIRKLEYSKFTELIDNVDKDGNVKADFLIKSSFIEFKKGSQHDFIQNTDGNINFIEFGIDDKYLFKIRGASVGSNNSNEEYYKVHIVTTDRVYFKRNDIFTPEKDGNLITIEGYDQDKNLSKFEEFNKNNITIITPDDGLLSLNYDIFKAFSYGCQFVSIFYHKIDDYALKYNNFFDNRPTKLKPKLLRKTISKKPVDSIFKLYKNPDINIDYPVNYDFLPNFKDKEVEISMYGRPDVFWVKRDAHKSKVSPNKFTSLLVVEEGLSSEAYPYSISFKLENKYLRATDNCCYLSFQENDESEQFKVDCSFYPCMPFCNIDGYHSFVSVKNKTYMSSKDNYKGFNYTKPYYIRYKTDFNPKNRLYSATTKFYNKIIELNHNNKKINIFRPIRKEKYYSVGDIGVVGDNMPKETKVYGGAVAFPIDYELIYDNKNINENDIISIWKPIPPQGYISIGYIFNNTYDKPGLEDMVCVASEYTLETDIEDVKDENGENGSLFTRNTDMGQAFSLWKKKSDNNTIIDPFLVSASIFKPSRFDNIAFKIVEMDKDFNDRLYIDKFQSDKGKETACFKVIDKTKPSDEAGDNAKNIINSISNDNEYKIVSNRPNDLGGNMCLSLHTPQWTDVYPKEPGANTKNPNNGVNYNLSLGNCREKKYLGTNWYTYGDNTIRFKENPDYCLKSNINSKRVSISKCSDDNNNDIYKFLIDENTIKTIPKNDERSYCLGYDDNENIKLMKCNENNIRQMWKLEVPLNNFCLDEGKMIFVKNIISRNTEDKFFLNIDTRIKEKYDFKNFTVYRRALITLIKKNNIVTFKYLTTDDINDNGEKNIYSDDILLDEVPNINSLKPGTEVICMNGGFVKSDDNELLIYPEENIMWKGIIVGKDKDKENNFKVFMSLNSIELNPRNKSYNRPRYIQEKSVNIVNIRLIKNVPECKNPNVSEFDAGIPEVESTDIRTYETEISNKCYSKLNFDDGGLYVYLTDFLNNDKNHFKDKILSMKLNDKKEKNKKDKLFVIDDLDKYKNFYLKNKYKEIEDNLKDKGSFEINLIKNDIANKINLLDIKSIKNLEKAIDTFMELNKNDDDIKNDIKIDSRLKTILINIDNLSFIPNFTD